MIDPASAYKYARGVMRGIRRGTTFPPASRVPPQSAPGGSRVVATTRAPGWIDGVQTTEHTVNVPGWTREVSILQLTDVHIRTADASLAALCELVSRERPDMVVLTGDVVTRGWTREAADLFLAALPVAPLGRYAILGNWEYWGGAPPATWRWVCDRHDVRLLVDESVVLDGFTLVGTDDLLAGRPDVSKAFAGVSGPLLGLTHSPGLFPEMVRPDLGVVLSGHTHGGQVVFPGVGTIFLPRASGSYPWGWYRQADSWLFVSRGLGWSVAPVRFRCPPEIARIRIVPGPRSAAR